MYIMNPKMVNTVLRFEVEAIPFNEEGVAEVISEDLGKELLAIDGFSIADEETVKKMEEAKKKLSKSLEQKAEAQAEQPKLDPIVPDSLKDFVAETKDEVNFDAMTVKELDAYAKENKVADYPKDGKKDEKVEAIKKSL